MNATAKLLIAQYGAGQPPQKLPQTDAVTVLSEKKAAWYRLFVPIRDLRR